MEKQHFESIQYYRNIAKKFLNSSFSYLSKNLKQDLSDELVTILMLADYNFNGTGTIEGYRKSRCRYHVLDKIKKVSSDKLRTSKKIDDCIYNAENLSEIIPLQYIDIIKDFLLYKVPKKEIIDYYDLNEQSLNHIINFSLSKIREAYNDNS